MFKKRDVKKEQGLKKCSAAGIEDRGGYEPRNELHVISGR
jgi:hypothetical protein